MPRFMITRTLPELTADQLEAARIESSAVCRQLGIIWVRSHLSADGKFSFCEYDAPSDEAVREHSRLSGIPFDEIMPLGLELGPSWAG